MEHEDYLVDKLKVICGINYVHFIEGILSNHKSQSLYNCKYFEWTLKNDSFDQANKITTNVKKILIFKFKILDGNYWPKYSLKELTLQYILKANEDNFNKFFKSSAEGKGKCFKFIHNYSNVEIETNLFKLTKGNNNDHNPITIIVNNFQAAILDIFNKIKFEQISLSEISKILNLNEEDLKENIFPLMFGIDSNLLEKVSNNKLGIEDSILIADIIKLNVNFSTKKRILNFANLKKNDQFIRKEKIAGERSSAIEANIVKIMKQYKVLQHHDLVEKVLNCLEKFKINISVNKIKIIYFYF